MAIKLDFSRDALFFDIDGTLLDIAPDPRAVHVPPELPGLLKGLSTKLGGALGLISGRAMETIDTFFAPLILPAAGTHGAQWRLNPADPVTHADPLPAFMAAEIIAAFGHDPRFLVEDKTYAIAVHYRQAPEEGERTGVFLETLLAQVPEPLTLLRGKKVFEIIRPGFNKGAAVQRFMAIAPFAGRRPIFIGDDVTDIPAMQFCESIGGLAVAVGDGLPVKKVFASAGEVREWIYTNCSS
jgi:trehalose 6-phosphate phosphatase